VVAGGQLFEVAQLGSQIAIGLLSRERDDQPWR
jgi:hypothetical protein